MYMNMFQEDAKQRPGATKHIVPEPPYLSSLMTVTINFF